METNYPRLLERIKAVTTDSVVLIILMAFISYTLSLLGEIPNPIRIIAFVFVFILYDPLLTSLLGGTLGHQLIGLRVTRIQHPGRNLPIHLAILRFIVKALLGWLSLLTVTGNAKRQALHDMASQSIVVYKEDEV